LIALADRRTEIHATDVDAAAEIRIALYRRFAEYVRLEGGFAPGGHMMVAAEQLAAAVGRHGRIKGGRLKTYSRAYQRLDLRERTAVLDYLSKHNLAVKLAARQQGFVLVDPGMLNGGQDGR